MKRIALALLLIAPNAICQPPAKEPDTLQALLAEVHQLRQDIEAMTVASQRVQIALYALQMQDAAVARAAKRLDDIRTKRIGAETGRDRLATQVQQFENAVGSSTMSPEQLKDVQQRIPMMKSELDRSTAELQSLQASESDAAAELRTEQTKMGELQDRIDRLDKVLEKMAAPGK